MSVDMRHILYLAILIHIHNTALPQKLDCFFRTFSFNFSY